MNSTSQKINWLRLISVVGISLAVVALSDVVTLLINWDNLTHLQVHNGLQYLVQLLSPQLCFGELICGILVFNLSCNRGNVKYCKITGGILIIIAVSLFLFSSLIPVKN